jgi:hypothetical protein
MGKGPVRKAGAGSEMDREYKRLAGINDLKIPLFKTWRNQIATSAF